MKALSIDIYIIFVSLSHALVAPFMGGWIEISLGVSPAGFCGRPLHGGDLFEKQAGRGGIGEHTDRAFVKVLLAPFMISFL